MSRRTRRNPIVPIGDVIDVAPVGAGPFAGVQAKLSYGRSAVLQAVGDSTVLGQGVTDPWTALMADRLGVYYDANVWSSTWQGDYYYGPPTVRRTSTQGERTFTPPAGSSTQYFGPSVTGDLEIILKVNLAAWTGSSQTLFTKWVAAGNQKGFYVLLGTTGTLQLQWSPDGSTAKTATSTASVGFTGGTAGWIRITLDVDNLSSGNTVNFYTSTTGTSWTALGSAVVTAGVTSIFDNVSTPYQLWSSPNAATFSWVQARNALSTGTDTVPTLPEQWMLSTGTYAATAGGPTILLMNGALGGQDINWADNTTRLPALFTAPNPDVVLIGLGINDTDTGVGPSNWRQFTDAYLTFVRHIKNYRPNVPIIATTQNPVQVGTTFTSAYMVQQRAARLSALATAMAGEPGLTVLPTHLAYTDLSTQLQSDKVHPTDAGQVAQANWMLRRLAPSVLL